MANPPGTTPSTPWRRMFHVLRAPPGTPPAIAAGYRLVMAFQALAFAGGALFVLTLPTGIVRIAGLGTLSIVVVPLALGGVWWSHGRIERTFRIARAHECTACPACLYDLRDLDETGVCPECGHPYEHTSVQIRWVQAERQHRLWRESQHNGGGGG